MSENNKKEITKDNINKFLIDYFFWINLFIILVILLLGIWFFIIPEYQNIFNKSVNSKVKMEEQYLEKSKNLAEIEGLISAYNNVSEKDKEKILTIIPDKAGIEDLIQEIEVISKKSGLILESIKVTEVENKDSSRASYYYQPEKEENNKKLPSGVGAIKIDIKLVGTDYLSLRELLKAIENHMRLFDIDNINFDPDKEVTSLEITTYYIKGEN